MEADIMLLMSSVIWYSTCIGTGITSADMSLNYDLYVTVAENLQFVFGCVIRVQSFRMTVLAL